MTSEARHRFPARARKAASRGLPLAAALQISRLAAALVCDAPLLDFGARPDTDLGFTHTFALRNDGAEPLVIAAVRSSCDCVAAASASATVRPGERVPVDARFDFRGESGPQLRAVHVAYRPAGAPPDAPLDVCSLTLRGSIQTPVIRLPNRLDLGAAPPGSVATGAVALVAGRCGPFALRAVALADAEAHAEYAENVTATNHALRLLIPVPASSGPFAGLAVAATDLADAPNVPIQYAGRAAPFLEVRPAVLAAPLKGRPLQARLTVASPYGAAFRLLSASSTDPRVTVSAVQPSATNAAVTVRADAQAGRLDGALVRLATDHPVCRVLEVPIRAAPTR